MILKKVSFIIIILTPSLIVTFLSDNVFVQEDTIFVSQMNPDVTETEISDHFGSIGIIKVSHNLLCSLLFKFKY